MLFINPTGKGIRNDTKGDGHHNAPRGTGKSGSVYRYHDGVDFSAEKGQKIYMPVNGTIPRESLPYHNDLRWRGALIINPRITIKMWYFILNKDIIGTEVAVGTVIGYAQDIGKKYKGVTPHIHLRITKVDPYLLFGKNEITYIKDKLKSSH